MLVVWRLPRPPNVPLLRALGSLLDSIWGFLKGSWGVLVGCIDSGCLNPRFEMPMPEERRWQAKRLGMGLKPETCEVKICTRDVAGLKF